MCSCTKLPAIFAFVALLPCFFKNIILYINLKYYGCSVVFSEIPRRWNAYIMKMTCNHGGSWLRKGRFEVSAISIEICMPMSERPW